MAKASGTTHFLLVYNLDERRLHERLEFSDARDAVDAYHEMERKYLNARDEFEVVLIGSDSINTVMQTHASYFDGTVSRVRDLVEPIESALMLMKELEDAVAAVKAKRDR